MQNGFSPCNSDTGKDALGIEVHDNLRVGIDLNDAAVYLAIVTINATILGKSNGVIRIFAEMKYIFAAHKIVDVGIVVKIFLKFVFIITSHNCYRNIARCVCLIQCYK